MVIDFMEECLNRRDFLPIVHKLPMTLSVGYACGFADGDSEVIVSLKFF